MTYQSSIIACEPRFAPINENDSSDWGSHVACEIADGEFHQSSVRKSPGYGISARETLKGGATRSIRRHLSPAEMQWNRTYESELKSTRGHAPSNSRPGNPYSKLLDRHLELLSEPEQQLAPLALYHFGLIGMHEQPKLSFAPALHPLANHPRWNSVPWSSTRGTVEIADRMGLLQYHPREWREEESGTDSVSGRYVALSWYGDFLLYLEDEDGPYVIAWDCKSKPEKHGKPGVMPLARRTSAPVIAKAHARERVYVEYMAELGARCVQVSPPQIHKEVICNLKRLLNLEGRPVKLPAEHMNDLKEKFQDSLKSGVSPYKIICEYSSIHEIRLLAKCYLDQLIWQREVRVDLFRAIEYDRSLIPEERDVLIEYAYLFKRSA